ncbi:hypothetical protein BFG58_19985 [Enterobacter sp. ku-bf2]|nr:hypothetical protein BFG58_19985 [Enterobacter sp. ku-bf2]
MLVVIIPMQWLKVHSKIVHLIMGLFVFKTLQIKEMLIFIKVIHPLTGRLTKLLIPLVILMLPLRFPPYSLPLLMAREVWLFFCAGMLIISLMVYNIHINMK